jgi:AAA+ superfamily predicted ATPase
VTIPSSIELCRELAMLGAEASIALGDREIGDAHAGWPTHRSELAGIGARMRAASDRLVERVARRLPDDRLAPWLVAMCAAAELYPEAAAALSILAEDEHVQLVTPSVFARLAGAALGVPYVEALAHAIPGGVVERAGFVEHVEAAQQLRPRTQLPLRLAPAELAWLVTGAAPQAVARVEPPALALAFDRELVAGAARMLADSGRLCIRSVGSRRGRQLALDIATFRGEPALLVDVVDDLPAPATLRDGALVIVDLLAYPRPLPGVVADLAARLRPIIILLPHTSAVEPAIDAPPLALSMRRAIFDELTTDATDSLAARFKTSRDEARAAARAALRTRQLRDPATQGPVTADELARELLAQGARRMDRLVTHVAATATMDDLVVPPSLRRKLDDVAAFARVGPRVAAEWERATSLGGLSCLFAGPPGTGKTFAAQCLARTLGLNLYRIDLSQVVSKYIGETEKALSRVFEEAEAGHGVLLFDEADALFGKRSEVKDAHDRYANIEVGYLLQRMETFEGVSILTTNLRNNLDSSFLRRIRFFLEFPLPDAAMRMQLWERSLPPRTCWDGVRLDELVERFPLSGGDIHNAGLVSAHLAAASPSGKLRMEHLVVATYRELEKSGHSRSRDDFGPLAAHLKERSA